MPTETNRNAPRSLAGRTIVADAFHAPTRDRIAFLRQVAITLDEEGRITRVGQDAPDDAVRLPAGQFLMPGLVDLHVHAPQFPQLGTALDVPLEDWLNNHTFPLEARYADEDFAAAVYDDLVRALMASGTTTALYFATVHLPATKMLARLCLEHGQRGLVGKVAMDHPDSCPNYYRDESAEAAIAGTREVIDYIRFLPGNESGLVQPVITPRFVPSCTDDCLEGLGKLAEQTGVRVQSHVSESDWEHGHVQDRMGMSDAETLDHFGLMREHSVFAHATHLSDSDIDLMAGRGAGVAHCPGSNAYFSGAVFPLREALEKGLRVGLGTDISGGPISTIWEAARTAIMVSRIRESGVDAQRSPDERGGKPGARIDVPTAFHLATRGGAEALGLPVGSFEEGMLFDALAIDPDAAQGQIYPGPADADPELLIEKVLYGATRANIAAVWTNGARRV